jgi:hypothetical protein
MHLHDYKYPEADNYFKSLDNEKQKEIKNAYDTKKKSNFKNELRNEFKKTEHFNDLSEYYCVENPSKLANVIKNGDIFYYIKLEILDVPDTTYELRYPILSKNVKTKSILDVGLAYYKDAYNYKSFAELSEAKVVTVNGFKKLQDVDGVKKLQDVTKAILDNFDFGQKETPQNLAVFYPSKMIHMFKNNMRVALNNSQNVVSQNVVSQGGKKTRKNKSRKNKSKKITKKKKRKTQKH